MRGIGLGSAVRFSLTGEPGTWRCEEGVVIEVVPIHREPTKLRTAWDPRQDLVTRYVVQSRCGLALRDRRGLIVVAP